MVSYTYTAGGQKLRMSSSTGEVRDYIGPFQYLNNAPFEVTHEEGRVLPGSPNGYEYFLRDHLGNVRAVVANVNGAYVTQLVDYDPWGLELSGLGSGLSNNRAKFNGKETLSELGSGLLDFGARGYDAAIGRWGVVDPLAEVSRRFSPFVYGNNNPVRMIDPDGMETQEYQRSNRDDFGNVTFNGAAFPGEGGYISGSTNGVGDKGNGGVTISGDGPGKGTQSPNSTRSNSNNTATASAGAALGGTLGRSGLTALSDGLSSLGIGISAYAAAVAVLVSQIVTGDTHTTLRQSDQSTVVYIDYNLYPDAALHAKQAIEQKNILNFGILDRAGATARRNNNIANSGLAGSSINDRDEFPPALLIPAGNVSVEYVRKFDNRGAGSSIRHQLTGKPDGINVIVLPINIP